MADDQADPGLRDPLQRAAEAHARAVEAGSRVDRLRRKRIGEDDALPEALLHDLESARANARSAHERLLAALESSAAAHDRAADRFDAQAAGDPSLREQLAAKAASHRERAAADRERAEILRRMGA